MDSQIEPAQYLLRISVIALGYNGSGSSIPPREVVDDLNIFVQRLGGVAPVPGDPITGLDGRTQRAKDHTWMGKNLNLFARECDAQAFGNESHQARFQVSVLEDARNKA